MQRGGAPVGYLDEISPVEAASVVYLRLWADGSFGRDRVWADFEPIVGHEETMKALQTFGQLCSLCVNYGRRPLARHGINCRCLGGDEACFATFMSYVCEGEREDAFLMAANMVRPKIASNLVTLAEDFGAVLKKVIGDNDLGERQTTVQAPHPETANAH